MNDAARHRAAVAGRRATTFLALALASAAPPLLAQVATPEDRVVAAALRHWPPQYDLDDRGRPTGFAIEVMEAVAARAGLAVEYRLYDDFPSALRALPAGEVDLIPNCGITAERRERFLFTAPLETFVVSLFVRDDERRIAGLDDLAGRRVAIVTANVAVDLLAERPGVELARLPDVRSALFELLAGQADALVYPRPVVLALARDAGLADRIREVGEPLLEVKRGIALRPGSEALLRRLDRAIETFVHSPEYAAIYTRWYGAPDPVWTARRVAIAMGSMLLLSLLAMGLWRYRSVARLNRDLLRTIAERADAVARLREREEQLALTQRLEAIGRLAGGIAHDFNNILTAILGNAEVLEQTLADDSESRAAAAEIRESAQRAAGLTRQLLAFSRQQILRPALIDLNEVVAGLDDLLQRLLLSGRVELDLDLVPAPLPVIADSGQLGQVILNLVVNSRDALAEGGRIEVRTAPVELDAAFVEQHLGSHEGAFAMLEVRDDGPGIPADVLPRIFEPFFTLREGGTGLGLATVFGIVKQTGGYVTVDSAAGEGTTFRVYLPRAEAETIRIGATVADRERQAPSERLLTGSRTVLVAEDETTLRELVGRALTAHGYDVLTAADGEEAQRLAAAFHGHLDLLVTDIVMPGIDGRELARRLRAARPGLLVLFTSGFADPSAEIPSGDGFLPKPFGPGRLLEEIERMLGPDTPGGGAVVA